MGDDSTLQEAKVNQTSESLEYRIATLEEIAVKDQ